MVSAARKMSILKPENPPMLSRYLSCAVVLGMLMLPEASFAAFDSYRFFHVTIETPYYIFLFLIGFVLAPFFLMAILYWRFAGRNPREPDSAKTKDEE